MSQWRKKSKRKLGDDSVLSVACQLTEVRKLKLSTQIVNFSISINCWTFLFILSEMFVNNKLWREKGKRNTTQYVVRIEFSSNEIYYKEISIFGKYL